MVHWQEAKAMAVDAFHAEITDAGMDVSDLVLKLGMKSLAYETTWALLRPEQWTDIVRDGDEIRLGRRGGAEVIDLYGPGPLVTFKHLIGYNTGKIYKYVTMLLPKTCEVSHVEIGSERLGLNHPTYIKELDTIIRSEFELSRRDKFDLARVLGDGVKVAQIPPVQWLTVIRQLVKENPSREILVERR
jgi:hypothetical protein